MDIIVRPLRFWHGLQGVLLSAIGITVLGFFVSMAGLFQASNSILLLVAQSVTVALIFSGSVFAVYKFNSVSFTDSISFKNPNLLLMFIAVAGVIPAGILTDTLTFWLNKTYPWLFSFDNISELADFLKNRSIEEYIILTVVLSIFPAVSEEFLFRGLVLGSFKRDMPIHFAVLYSSVLFGIIHFSWLQGVAAGFIGIYLAFMVATLKSIIPAILAHFLNNLSWCIMARYGTPYNKELISHGYNSVIILISLFIFIGAVFMLISRRKT